MGENIDIQLTTYNRNQFDNAVNTEFTQFGDTKSTPKEEVDEGTTLNQFFNDYDSIFLQIPKQGETNSHQYLANRSGEYAGGEDINAEIEALTAEVTQLREDNIALQQQIIQLAENTTTNT